MRVFSDFDGTISLHDTTDAVLSRFADPAWEAIEAQWVGGAISAKECMQRQVELIGATRADLDAFLGAVAIDPCFSRFAQMCRSAKVPLIIVSDGVDYFIRRILARHGLDHLPVVANKLGLSDRGQWSLSPATIDIDCAAGSGVCKCSIVDREGQGPVVYIGDGRSDFCVVSEADVVFAKSKLALHCEQTGLRFTPFNSFADIARDLSVRLREVATENRKPKTFGDRVHA